MDRNKFPHASLITGKNGYGTLPIALALASYLLCEQRGSDSCGICPSCKRSFGLIHPDLHLSFPVVQMDGKQRKDTTSLDFLKEWRQKVIKDPYLSYRDWILSISKTTAKGDINVSECNEIIQRINLQSFHGKARIQIIWMAEYLGANANRLLKILEEPPDNTFFILICENHEFVLNTIKSRCQHIPVGRIDDDDIRQWANKQTPEESVLEQIVFLSGGDFSLAQQHLFMDHGSLMSDMLDWIVTCKSKNPVLLRDWVDEFSSLNHEEKKVFINYTLKVFLELFHWRIGGLPMTRLGKDDRTKLQQHDFLFSLKAGQIESLSKILSEVIDLLDRNVHSKILLFNSSLEIESVLNCNVVYS